MDKSWACDVEERRRTSGAKYGSLKCIVDLEDGLIVVKGYLRLINFFSVRVRTLHGFLESSVWGEEQSEDWCYIS